MPHFSLNFSFIFVLFYPLTFLCSASRLRAEKEKEEWQMKTVKISLNSIDKVKSFVNDITKFDNEFDLVSGRYVIDAKSIMGIFSLDLSKPIDLNIHAENNMDEILNVLQPYII